jgi:hypothetical protein
MRKAFAPEKGPPADMSTEGGERVARMELFAGAMGTYKYPRSHRDVDLNDPAEDFEIILPTNQSPAYRGCAGYMDSHSGPRAAFGRESCTRERNALNAGGVPNYQRCLC